MANMIQCDKCGAVRPYHEAYFIKCYQYSEPGKEPGKGRFKDGADLCTDCHDELMEECHATPVNYGEAGVEALPEEGEHNYG